MASKGDPRVLLVLNLVLSGVFSLVVVWGLAYATAMTFSWRNVAIATAVLMVLTHIVTQR